MTAIALPNGRKIGPGEPCFIVAEIGQNHNGDVYTATRLLKAAHDAGVDAVKFCKRDIDSDLTAAAQAELYTGPHSFGCTYGEHRRALELSIDDYAHLQDRMRYNGWRETICFTVCDIKSLYEVESRINPPLYKIASRDIDNLPLIRAVAVTGKPVILSCGMADELAIEEALECVEKHGCSTALLHCVSRYPTAMDEVGYPHISKLALRFCRPTGFSDHTSGIVAAEAAAAFGACIIEKHITLSRAMQGTDHAASLEPDGIRRLVRNVRAIESGMGEPAAPEAATQVKLRRSLVTTRAMYRGEAVTADALCLKSPGGGLQWRDRAAVIGAMVLRDIPTDTTLQAGDVDLPQRTCCRSKPFIESGV